MTPKRNGTVTHLQHTNKIIPTSTVGRGKSVILDSAPTTSEWKDELTTLTLGDSLDHYLEWDSPTVIISDGGYGVLGFEGDTSDHYGLPGWYENHIKEWSNAATPRTTLWFWNSEVGWAAIHPVLEKYGWQYINCNIWNKGKGHIAGNVNTAKIRRFPVVTEVCVQYVMEARIEDIPLKNWLLKEWKRSGLALRKANEACNVADAAVRKYLDQGHLWYFPPPEMFSKLSEYANKYGNVDGRPYFSKDGKRPMNAKEWAQMRSKFECPHGVTNVWERPALRGKERVKISSGKAVHLNQKPLDLMSTIIKTTSDEGDVVWEPFGGLFSGALAAWKIKRKAFACEIDPTYFHYGIKRFIDESRQNLLF